MGIQKDEKPPKKNLPKDIGVEKTIGLPDMNMGLPEGDRNAITPIEVVDRRDWT